MTPRLVTLDGPDALAGHAAAWLAARVAAVPGPFSLALSGGSTPRRLYERLASLSLPWDRIHLFWGDERFVPSDHPESNQRMVREALIRHVPFPPGNLHPIGTDGTPDEAARRYEAELRRFAAGRPGRPLFDLQLLGLGEDGHTASLFPGIAALAEREAWVVAVVGAKPEPRITLTYPALDSSAEVAFLASGAAKRAILWRFLAGDAALPAVDVRPRGAVTVFADRAASGG